MVESVAPAPVLLNVNNYHYARGGAELVFLEQSRLFEARGWETVPFCMHHPDNEPSPWSRFWVDEIEFGADYSLGQKIVRSGRVVYSRQARSRLGALLDEIRPDVAHLHNVYHHISPSILSLLDERGIPTVLTTHDLKLACPSYKMLAGDGICERCKGGRLHNAVLQRCVKDSFLLSSVVFVESAVHRMLASFDHVDRFISPSRFYIDTFVDWGHDRSRFVHVPNHVDATRFDPDFRPGDAIVYFGRLAPEKGLTTLVRAAAASGVPVVVVGAGPEAEPLQALVAETRAPVSFLGHRTGAALHDVVRGARATVLASEWYENGPMSVLESYALGTPVLGADIGGIPELVRDGETGLVFPSADVDALSEALVAIRDLPDGEVAAMGRAGRHWVETSFSATAHIDRLLAVYADLGVRTR